MKKCKICGEIKDETDFYRSFLGYLSSYCKGCSYECSKQYAQEHKESIRDIQKKWVSSNKEHVYKKNKERRDKIRNEVLLAYGGRCECCGENNLGFLSIYPKNDEEKETTINVQRLRARLKRLGFPDEYEVLCKNCRFSIVRIGFCEHNPTRRP